MDIVSMTQETAAVGCRLFNDAVQNGDMVYKPFEEKEFADFFLTPQDGFEKAAVICGQQGFAAGCRPNGSEKAYITMVAVEKESRRNGIGTALLQALEGKLSEMGEKPAAFEIVFFNPMNLTWIVPGTPGHDHPNAPGIDVSTGGYLFFKNMGYRDFATQNSYYIKLAGYTPPQDIESRKQKLAEKGVTIETYDSAAHTGLDDLLKDLDSPLWTKEIGEEVAKPGGGRPLLVPIKDGVVAGFTGPLDRQPSGRGYFAGIGVHSGYRGYGIAKVLFSSLVSGLGDIGADYMTLFTGETNPARNIYEAAGFKIVRTWADMRKEVK